MAIRELKRHKSPGIDHIQTELIIAGSRIIISITKHINSIWNREEMLEGWKDSIIVPISKKCDKTEGRNYKGI